MWSVDNPAPTLRNNSLPASAASAAAIFGPPPSARANSTAPQTTRGTTDRSVIASARTMRVRVLIGRYSGQRVVRCVDAVWVSPAYRTS